MRTDIIGRFSLARPGVRRTYCGGVSPAQDQVVARSSMTTPIGELTIIASPSAILEIRLPGSASASSVSQTPEPAASDLLDETVAQLRAYFEGRLTMFDLPLSPAGTQFQRAAWDVLRTIPHAETISYGEQAARMGRPTASRAVGSANGRNPIPIVVPCHRVIGADGSLTGFAGGVDTKRWLLEHECRVAARQAGARGAA